MNIIKSQLRQLIEEALEDEEQNVAESKLNQIIQEELQQLLNEVTPVRPTSGPRVLWKTKFGGAHPEPYGYSDFTGGAEWPPKTKFQKEIAATLIAAEWSDKRKRQRQKRAAAQKAIGSWGPRVNWETATHEPRTDAEQKAARWNTWRKEKESGVPNYEALKSSPEEIAQFETGYRPNPLLQRWLFNRDWKQFKKTTPPEFQHDLFTGGVLPPPIRTETGAEEMVHGVRLPWLGHPSHDTGDHNAPTEWATSPEQMHVPGRAQRLATDPEAWTQWGTGQYARSPEEREAGLKESKLNQLIEQELEAMINEKAVSKKQQRFMGMVHKCQETGDCASPAVRKAAKSMKKKDAEDFASTKHKGLPEKKKKKKAKRKK